MDAIEFVKTIQRKIKNENRDEIIIRITDDANLLVDLTEEWAKENPIKTRQSKFLEQFPEAELDASGVITICPALLSDDHRNSDRVCKHPGIACFECCHEFWMKEIE